MVVWSQTPGRFAKLAKQFKTAVRILVDSKLWCLRVSMSSSGLQAELGHLLVWITTLYHFYVAYSCLSGFVRCQSCDSLFDCGGRPPRGPNVLSASCSGSLELKERYNLRFIDHADMEWLWWFLFPVDRAPCRRGQRWRRACVEISTLSKIWRTFRWNVTAGDLVGCSVELRLFVDGCDISGLGQVLLCLHMSIKRHMVSVRSCIRFRRYIWKSLWPVWILAA